MSFNEKEFLQNSKDSKNKQKKSFKDKKRIFKEKTINNFKLLIKDLKRARWISSNEIKHSFIRVVIFIVVISLILFGIAFGFSALWSVLGVGING